jgi:hypothetical protein
VSRGIGGVQRRVLDALIQRRDYDYYGTETVHDLLGETEFSEVRARYRWYTVDLLDLVEFGGSRSERVSLHRAVRGLHRRGRVDITTSRPYEQPFGAYYDDYGYLAGGLDLSELSTVDPRWSSGPGRCLWFRLKVPVFHGVDNYFPFDDQMTILDEIVEYQVDAFRDFAETLNRRDAWNSDTGRFIRWLFCGPLPHGRQGP